MGKTSKIIYAIGDIHADKSAAVDTFEMAKLCDNNETWIAENVVVVQTGDLTDRGPDGKSTLELFRKWEMEAAKKNSELILLMGNHEAMNIQGDWRYVSPQDVHSFGSLEERKKVFMKGGGGISGLCNEMQSHWSMEICFYMVDCPKNILI